MPYRFAVQVAACVLCLCLYPASTVNATTDGEERRLANEQVQRIVSRLKGELAIGVEIVPVIVPANSRLVSIQRQADARDGGSFVMSFDEQFLAGLDEEALTAIVAHELGHVWIFTHHPYLQTERLANSVAMRVVSRESLARVYARVWERAGGKGDLVHFLGQ